MKTALKVGGIILLLLLLVLGIASVAIYAQSEALINQHFSVSPPELELPEVSDEILAEGRRIFTTRGCTDCHGANGAGTVLVDDTALGRIVVPNLTRGAGGLDYTAEQYLNAIMHGVNAEGRGLVIMPSLVFTHWREEEIGPLIVYLLNLPPVDNEQPETIYGPLGRVLIVAGVLPMGATKIDHSDVGFVDIAYEPSIEYGEYLYNVCVDCHLPTAAGGLLPASDYASANLTPSESGIEAWSEQNFMNALRTGQRPDGTLIDGTKMPWPSFAPMTDTEIGALYAYLRSVPPVENEN